MKLSYPIRYVATLPVRFYRKVISPLKPPCCRYSPSCSEYALGAIMKHGIIFGGYLAVRRILRCNPFGGSGHDPVPEYGALWPEKQIIKLKEKIKAFLKINKH